MGLRLRREMRPWHEYAAGAALGLLAMIIVWLLVVAADPAKAADTRCLTVDIDWAVTPEGHSYPKVTANTSDTIDGEIRYAVVGHFVWFQWGHTEADSLSDETLSWDLLPDAETATACTDGTVILTWPEDVAPVVVLPVPPAEPVVVVVPAVWLADGVLRVGHTLYY